MASKDRSYMGVIGAGDMGHGICEVIALAGIPVYLYEQNQELLDKGLKRIQQSLDKLFEKRKIDENTYNKSRECLLPTLDLEKLCKDSSFIIEAVPEVLKIKQSVFKELDALTDKKTILATNTSNMSISKIASVTKNPERVVGVHFFNPVVLMDLVEVIRGKETTDKVMDEAYELCQKLNKSPVRVEKDSPSFIVNRINAPVRTYLGAIVDKGDAEPYEVDALFKYHNHPMGHFELSDFVGLDILYDSCKYREDNLHHEFGPYLLLEEKVQNKKFGKKSGEGFYDWGEGRPQIDINNRTNILEMADLDFIKYNEATKLIEDEISTAKDIDLAMKLGTGDKKGPIASCRHTDKKEIVDRLNYISEKYEKDVLKPSEYLKGEMK